MNIDAYLDPQYGIYDYLLRAEAPRAASAISAFRCHGSLRRDAALSGRLRRGYGVRAGTAQLHRLDLPERRRRRWSCLGELGIPVWVMEPLRGGKLAALADEAAAALRKPASRGNGPGLGLPLPADDPGRDDDAFRDVELAAALRGNIRTFETDEPLSAAEMRALSELGRSA